jgi:hypothetical protein
LNAPTIVTTLSISEYLHDRLLNDLFDGPLTEDEFSEGYDSTDDCPLDQLFATTSTAGAVTTSNPVSPPKPASLQKKQKEKDRLAKKRRHKRQAAMDASKTSLKAVLNKRQAMATKDVLQVDFAMSTNSSVTNPGWIGRPNVGLPAQTFTLRELVYKFGLTHFPWDGK